MSQPYPNTMAAGASQGLPQYALPYLAPPQMGAPQASVPYHIFSIKGLGGNFAMALSAPFLNLPTAIKFSYEAILRAGLNNKLPLPIAGLSTPARGDDPVVKLLAKRLQADHVAMMLAINVAFKTNGPNVEKNFEKFAIIVRSFGIMHEGDIVRVKRKIDREPMLSHKGKDLLTKAVDHDFSMLERFLELPRGIGTEKAKRRRNFKITKMLLDAMRAKKARKAKKEEIRLAIQKKEEDTRNQKAAADKALDDLNADIAAYLAVLHSVKDKDPTEAEKIAMEAYNKITAGEQANDAATGIKALDDLGTDMAAYQAALDSGKDKVPAEAESFAMEGYHKITAGEDDMDAAA